MGHEADQFRKSSKKSERYEDETSGPVYKVSFSAAVRESLFRQLLSIQATEEHEAALQSALWIEHELQNTPSEFGESREELPDIGIRMRIGFAGPITVIFGVHEATKQVFVRSFALMKGA